MNAVPLSTISKLPDQVGTAAPFNKNTDAIAFSDVLSSTLDAISAKQNHASQLIKQVELGESDDLVGAMLASQKASLSFDVLVAVRNKAMTAYQDLIKMPL